VVLIRALRAKLDEMTAQLALVEHHAVTTRSGSMASALRSEAAALRRDIAEALFLITRLQHRYPDVDEYPAAATQATAQAASMEHLLDPFLEKMKRARPGAPGEESAGAAFRSFRYCSHSCCFGAAHKPPRAAPINYSDAGYGDPVPP
jgi:hypothetical protein